MNIPWHIRCSLARIKATSVQSGTSLRLRPVAWDILRYLSAHPHAQDTLEGIVEWWLMEQRIKHAIEEGRAALDQLTARRLILARQHRDGRTYYQLNQERREEICQELSRKTARTTARTTARKAAK